MQYGAGRGDKTIIKCARSRACRFDRRVELEGLSRPVVLGATIRPIYPQVNRNIISLSLSLQPPPPPPPLPSPVRLPVHTMSHPPAAPVLTRPRSIDLSAQSPSALPISRAPQAWITASHDVLQGPAGRVVLQVRAPLAGPPRNEHGGRRVSAACIRLFESPPPFRPLHANPFHTTHSNPPTPTSL